MVNASAIWKFFLYLFSFDNPFSLDFKCVLNFIIHGANRNRDAVQWIDLLMLFLLNLFVNFFLKIFEQFQLQLVINILTVSSSNMIFYSVLTQWHKRDFVTIQYWYFFNYVDLREKIVSGCLYSNQLNQILI